MCHFILIMVYRVLHVEMCSSLLFSTLIMLSSNFQTLHRSQGRRKQPADGQAHWSVVKLMKLTGSYYYLAILNVSLMLAHLRTLPDFTTAIQSGKVECINYILTLAEKLWSGHGRTSRTGSGAYGSCYAHDKYGKNHWKFFMVSSSLE